jgi:hypothetical protein
MKTKLVFLATGLNCTLAASAFAMPTGEPSSSSDIMIVRTVCDQYGRCREENPAEEMTRGVIRGLGGRGGDRDYDRDREYRRRGRDGDGGYRRRERDDDD